MTDKLEYESLETIVREPNLSDAKAVIGLLRHISRESDFIMFDPAITVERERELIGQYMSSRQDLFLVIEVDGQLVGLANLISKNHSRQSHVAELGLAIVKEYWGYGMGTVLMEEMIDFAKERDLKVLTLEVMTENQRALGLYHKFEFKEVGHLHKRVQIDYRYYDTLIMEKVL